MNNKKTILALLVVLLSLPLVSAAWFDNGSTWQQERTLSLTGVNVNDVIRIDVNSDNVSPFGNLFAANVNDGNTFAFVNCNSGVQAFHQLLNYVQDSNIAFDVAIGANTGTICMRYGDDTNTLNTAQPFDTYTFFDDFSDTNSLSNPDWVSNGGVWTVIGGRMQWDSGADADTISSDLGSSESYSSGFSMRSQISNGCGASCGFGISNNADPRAAVADADGYEIISDVGSGLLRIQELVNGNNSGMQIGTNFAWGLGNTFEMRRDSSGNFQFLLNNGHSSVVPAGSDTSTTTGQYVYAIHGTTTSEHFAFVSFTNNFNVATTETFGAEVVQDSNALTITVLDEIALTAISGATIDFNSGTYTTNGAGQISIPLSGIPADANTQFTINIDVNADYTARDFIFDLNRDSDVSFTGLMLETSSGRSIEYQIFQPDESTLITNSIVEFRRNLLTFQGLSGRLKTNSVGKLTAFVQDDANYVMRIFDATTAPITQRDYNGTLVNVKIPLNITNTSQQLTPFAIEVGGLAQETLSGLTSDTTVQIFSDTVEFYNIAIDFNSDFFPTSILIQTTGGQTTSTFQPYLVPQTGNLASIIFTINNINQKQTIPDILIVSETVIDGGLVVVESKESDITGTAEFHFQVGRTYTLSFFDSDGVLIFSGQLDAKSVDTELFAALAERVLFVSPEPGGIVNISWIPVVGSVQPIDGNITLTQLLTPFNTIIGDVNIFITHLNDANVIFNRVFTLDSSAADQNITFDVNVSGFNADFPLNVNLQIFDTNGALIGFIQIKEYYFIESRIVPAFDALKTELGEFPVMFISVILATVALGLVTFFSPSTNNNWVGILGVILTGFFVIISWIPIEAWLIATAMTIGMFLWRDREQ